MARTPEHPTSSPPLLFATLGDIFGPWCADSPDDVALIDEDRHWSVADFADLIGRQQRALTTRCPPGARVGLHAATSAEACALVYSVPASGRTLVPLNTRLTMADKTEQLVRAEVALLVGEPVDGFQGPTVSLDTLFSPADAQGALPEVGAIHATELAWIIFTSGSTGKPKAALVTHGSLAAAVATTALARPLSDNDVYLYPFPLFHISAYNVLHAHARRRSVVLPNRFDASTIIALCHRHHVTVMSLAATMLRMLLDGLRSEPNPGPPPSLGAIVYGAAPMPPSLLAEAFDVLGCDFAQGYGSTELSGNAVFLGRRAHRQLLEGDQRFAGAAGYAGDGVRLRIVDESGTDLPAGEPGELLVSAPQVCAGYLDDPRATAETIVDGWLHTGDIAVLESDGLLSIVDRAKDIVVTGGENVSSREVEDALRSHWRVREVAVVGTPDAHWGEAVTAAIVLSDDGTPISDAALFDDLGAHVESTLAGYKKPRRFAIVTSLPTNANGKVDKPALRRSLRADDLTTVGRTPRGRAEN